MLMIQDEDFHMAVCQTIYSYRYIVYDYDKQ